MNGRMINPRPSVRTEKISPPTSNMPMTLAMMATSSSSASALRPMTPRNSSGAVSGSGRCARPLNIASIMQQEVGSLRPRARPCRTKTSARELSRRLQCEIGEDAVGTGPFEGPEALHHRRLAIDGARVTGKLEHRVLAADLVGEHRHVEAVADPANQVEIGHAGFD